MSHCSSTNSILFVLDVKNVFQNTIAQEKNRIFVNYPPTYLDWIYHTNPSFWYDKSKKYYCIILHHNQGTKDAGNQWHHLLAKVFKQYGMTRCTVDHGFFCKDYDKAGVMLVSMATDDLLCSVPTYCHEEDFIHFMSQYFDLSVQTIS